MGKYRSLLVNLGLFTLNTLATKVVTFLLVPFFTYYFSTSEYGITDMGTVLINVLVPILTIASNDAAIRFVIDDPDNSKRYVSIGFWLTLLGCLVMGLLLPILDLPMFGGLGHYKFLYFFDFIGVAYQIYFGYVARGRNQILLMTWVSIVSSLVTAGTAVFFVKCLNMRTEGFFLSMIAGNGFAILLYLTFGRHYTLLKLPFENGDVYFLKKMLIFVLPTIPNLVFWWMGTSVNRFFITIFMGVSASGVFAAISKIPGLMNILSNTFWQAWSLSAFQEYRNEGVTSFFSRVFCLFRAVMAICASAIALLTPWLASILLQKDFFKAWPIIPILIVAFYFSVLSGFYETVFTTSMKTKGLFFSTGLAALVIIIFTWALIPRFGLIGAAIAMLLGNFSMFFVRIFQIRSIMKVQTNWIAEIATILLLLVQATIMYCQPNSYIYFSEVIFMFIFLIKLIEVSPLIHSVMRQVTY